MITKGSGNILKEKPRNLKYAPGIATYGVKGKTGPSGQDGTAVFFCDYDITDVNNENPDCGLAKALKAISSGRVLLERYKSLEVGRPYRNGDIVVSYTGVIYELRNLNLISLFDIESALTDSWSEFFLQRGSVLDTPEAVLRDDKGAETEIFRVGADGRVYFNSVITNKNTDNFDGQAYKALFQGLDIASVGAEQTAQDNNYILRVYNSTGRLISVSARTSVNEESYLNIYYDKDDTAFHIESNVPVCFDTPAMKIKNPIGGVAESINEYSPVITSENADSISSFYRMCSLAKWTGTAAGDSFQITFDCSGYEFITNYYNNTLKDQLYCCFQESVNGSVVRRIVSMDGAEVKYNDTPGSTNIVATVTKTKGAEIQTVSLIRNIECYIVKG